MFSLNDFYKDVIDWNAFSGNRYNNSELVDVYVSFVEEEMSEMFDEIDEGNDVGYLNELADSLVVGSFLYAVVNSEDFSVYDREPEAIDDFEQSIVKLKKLFNQKNHSENINTLLEMLEDIAYSSDMDVIAACEEVMTANWSKFPLVTDVDPEKEVQYIEKDGRYKGVTYETRKDAQGNERYIFKSDTGKVVKPSTFKKADLTDLV